MSKHAAKNSLPADEPVVVGHAVLWAVASAGEYLVGHAHLVSAGAWSPIQSTIVPLITTAVLAGSAVVMRRFVEPAAKAAQRREDSVTRALAGVGVEVDLPTVDDVLSAAARAAGDVVEAATAPPVS